MRRALVIACLLTAGCGGESTDDTSATEASEIPTTDETIDVPTEAEISGMAFESVVADAQLVNVEQARGLAETTCEELDSGSSPDTAGAAMLLALSRQYPSGGGQALASDTGLVMGAGVIAFCPEHNEETQAYFDTLGPLTRAMIIELTS